MYCIVSTFNKTFDELGLIYFIPSFLEEEVKLWMFVEVPMGNKIEIAFVIKVWDLKSINILNINESKIKSIISIKNDTIFLNTNQIELLKFISIHYFTHIHNSLSLFFPKNLREKILKNKVKLEEESINYNYNFNKELSKNQESVYTKIMNSKNNKFLLHWVTWSWKTEIYIRLIKKELDKNKQSLLLIPEIILTNQLETRLKKVFWDEILTLNSSITDANKTKAWSKIYSNDAKIIIWTRSALFYPFNNLWLIIIDEEHDNSYKSDQAPRYNAIDIAEKITAINWNKLMLASWTPSISSMHKAVKKEYELLKLFEVYNKQ